jgi:hypothetical protein
VLQKGFPERMALLWLAEPPAVFAALWKLMAPFVAPATREKSARPSQCASRVLACGETLTFALFLSAAAVNFVAGKDVAAVVGKHVDAALLPADWGGTTALRPLDAGPAVWEPRFATGDPPPRRRY